MLRWWLLRFWTGGSSEPLIGDDDDGDDELGDDDATEKLIDDDRDSTWFRIEVDEVAVAAPSASERIWWL